MKEQNPHKITAPSAISASPEGKKNKGLALMIFNEAMCFAMLILCTVFTAGFPLYLRIIIYTVLAALIFLGVLLPLKGRVAAFKFTVTADISALLILISYIILDAYGVFQDLSNIELIKSFILSTGPWGKVVFILLTILQTVVLPIPALVVSLVGTALYGRLEGFIYCTVGVMIGTVICFYIGRLFGPKIVNWIVGEEKTTKYRDILNNKGRFVFILMMLFPAFPDDILCMVAGLTTMKFGYFFIVTLLTRPVMLAFYSFFGTGEVIPFGGWGIWVWIAAFIAAAALFVLLTKYQEKLVELFDKGAKRRKEHGFAHKDKPEL
ncbi:MAG: TVP38/TMEM64 family protein [Clostridiales bacterium]|jgi:uncharacterized membrane protein YdjX (TVP38/TMEM64 family)|nr:TVP38/TMEM64 family protein [Clostridiales bacterium]